MEGKEEFYKKAEEALKKSGYQYYGEKDIVGIGSGHSSKPDYIAVKDGIVVVGEIKSPKEGPKSAMWRQSITVGISGEGRQVTKHVYTFKRCRTVEEVASMKEESHLLSQKENFVKV